MLCVCVENCDTARDHSPLPAPHTKGLPLGHLGALPTPLAQLLALSVPESSHLRPEFQQSCAAGAACGGDCDDVQDRAESRKDPATPQTDCGPTGVRISLYEADLRNFNQDLMPWVKQVSEVFHLRIFILEFVGQSLYCFFGPLSLPLLFKIYGSRIGLINRGFWRGTPFFILGIVYSLLLTSGIVISIVFKPDGVTRADLSFLLLVTFMRTLVMAVKYAYMTTSSWRRLGDELMSFTYLLSLLLGRSWSKITPETLAFQAEISFVGVLGSRQQRERLYMKFMAWPISGEELNELRRHCDVTSKTLMMIPTGELQRPDSFRRRPVRVDTETLHSAISASSDQAELMTMSNQTTAGPMPGINQQLDLELHHHYVGSSPASHMPDPGADNARADRLVSSVARGGGTVAIEDVFLYMLRGVMASEKVMLPYGWFRTATIFFSLITVLSPALVRAARGGPFFGTGAVSVAAVICFSLAAWFGMAGVMTFIGVAVRDMWRRRALMRSCAALLTVESYYRRSAPAEVAMLPIVDLSDPDTIEAWRKLRQLCIDFGKFYRLRITIFTSWFSVCVLVVTLNLVLSLNVPWYRRLSPVDLGDIVAICILLLCVVASILAQVDLGGEVNASAGRHCFLLARQRTLFASASSRRKAEARQRGEEIDEAEAERAVDFLDVLCQDIQAEHRVRPITLLGVYCGYSLLSSLYVIPAIVVTSLSTFCFDTDTQHHCAL